MTEQFFFEEAQQCRDTAAFEQVVEAALESKEVHHFGEFLSHPNCTGTLKRKLELFAYGTLKDCDASTVLTPAQRLKLQKLSVVHLCADKSVVPYADLMDSVGVGDEQSM